MNDLCTGCRFIQYEKDEGNYCYMFEKAPDKLPCGQHDKFKELVKANGEILRRNPLLFAAIIRGMGGHL